MICGMTVYQILWFFLIYSFLGWITEVVYHAVTNGKVINRGFLNGPVCPVYGSGVVLVFMAVGIIEQNGYSLNGIWIFVFGIAVATAVELIAGWALDVIFHARWWDYSNKPFNLHGYICLEFSIIWGLGIVFIVRVFHSGIVHFVNKYLAAKYGFIPLLILFAVFITDVIVTVAVIRGLNKKLHQIEKLRTDMRAVSDRLSERVGTSSIEAAQKIGETKVQAALARAELRDAAEEARENLIDAANDARESLIDAAEEARENIISERDETIEELKQRSLALQKRIEDITSSLTKHRQFGVGHLLNAFPNMKHRSYADIIDILQDRLKRK